MRIRIQGAKAMQIQAEPGQNLTTQKDKFTWNLSFFANFG